MPASDPFEVPGQGRHGRRRDARFRRSAGRIEGTRSANTQSASAYDLYLQGLGYLQNYDRKERKHQNAIRVFDNALALDADFAAAYAGRGDADWQMYENTKDAKWIDTSREDCQRALRLNESLPAAHVCLGRLDERNRTLRTSGPGIRARGLCRATNNRAYLELARTYDRLGNPAKAEETYRRAIKLRPHYWAGYNWLGAFYYQRAQYQDAARDLEQVTLLFAG